MKQSTKDQIQGKFHETKGVLKQKVGSATGNPEMEDDGRAEKVAGKVQTKAGQVEKVLEQ